MNNDPSTRRAVAVFGPTAAGKSALGRELAVRLGLPILVCDSVKVYRRLDIGSAKPGAAARAAVPHRLIDLVDPDQPFTAGDYSRAAWAALGDGPGLFVGGTGLYLRATAWTQTGQDVEGISTPTDDPGRVAFEQRWHERENAEKGAAHRALAAIDPDTADGIHPHNLVRILRALWLCEVHGGPVSLARRNDPPRPRLHLMLLLLDPGAEALDSRIEARVDAMLAAGWLAEVEMLREAGYDARHKAMRSLGYRQLLEVVQGRMDLSTARKAIVVATRQYARRQRTYMRRQLPAAEVVPLADAQACPFERVVSFVAGGGS